ncbi:MULTISPECIES: sensor histidine kinase [unclassified Streptomyces]|uniref:sensor histidine kinase n=1 Tax=unclassified Streptomyces TaxID=2593676 RepID=UPI001F0CC7E1|nr:MULTISPECIES: HAMP domain-containing sensor histidine kinase [unclassified Streptomyces]
MIHRRRRPGGRPRTLSIQGRLFLGFGGALALCSALMVTIIYVGIRYLPTYDFTAPYALPTAPPDGPVRGQPVQPEPPVAGEPTRESEAVDVAGLIRDKEDVWHTVLAVSVGGVTLVMLVGLGVGRHLARRLLAPLADIGKAAAKAGEGDLAYRINATGPRDELRQLADTFDTTLHRLQESFEAHQRFAANASHELLTPLATNRAILQVAAADPDGEEFAELVPMLVQTNERNITIVNELLQLAAAGQVRYDAEPVDLAGVTAEAVEEARAGAPASGVEITADLPDRRGAGFEVAGNEALMRRVVANLLDNACVHNVPEGWVHVRVRTEGVAGAVVLEVDNTGPGVDPDTVDHLFEPFFRARPRIASDRGHGLGLAIVRSVVQAHRGTVDAEANASGGLRVRVTLPAAGG